MLEVSVHICTHNPRPEYLSQVIEALRGQTLDKQRWELLLVDNASREPIASRWDLSWHPLQRSFREETLGKTHALVKAITESRADLLVTVDDDNVLDADYLENCLRVSRERPYVGAWGGQVRGKFEVEPPAWAQPYLGMLAIRELHRDMWSNLTDIFPTIPYGAGMCVRKTVADEYARRARADERRLKLDRVGSKLTGCGDTDLALTACDMGMGTGLFRSLKLTHLIPAGRLREEYFVGAFEGCVYSDLILRWLRGQSPPALPRRPWYSRMMRWIRLRRMTSIQRQLELARDRATRQAIEEIQNGAMNHGAH